MANFFCAFLACLFLTPFVIRFAAKRKLFDTPNQRKVHEEEIPRLGGVALTGSFLIGIFLTAQPETIFSMKLFLAGLLILFFVGLWDDLQPISPLIKLTGEIIPVVLLVLSARIPIENEYFPYADYLATIVLSFWIINAFNLVDGINGLAGTIGFIAFTAAAVAFPETRPLCLSMAGAIAAFLFFNFLNPKIFLGDSGSLIIGYCIVYAMTGIHSGADYLPLPKMTWPFILPLVSLPMFDMVRVFMIRIFKKKNPFEGDRNHLHHLLLETGYSHVGATLIINLLTICNFGFTIALFYLNMNFKMVLVSNVLIPFIFTAILWKRVRLLRRNLSDH